jgi:hypothetical protein
MKKTFSGCCSIEKSSLVHIAHCRFPKLAFNQKKTAGRKGGKERRCLFTLEEEVTNPSRKDEPF